MLVLSFDVGIKNLSYCLLNSDGEQIIKWELVTLEINSRDKDKICLNLINKLDSIPDLLTADRVLIEKQPSFNPTMRIIAGCLQTYFLIRGVIDGNSIKRVIIYSPTHKLKCYTGPPFEVKGSTKYARTKKTGILHCEYIISNNVMNASWVEFFKKCKKKDDLADSFLQGLSYIRFVDESGKSGVKPRRPTVKQISKNNYSKANLKYMLGEKFREFNARSTIDKFFGSTEEKNWSVIQKNFSEYLEKDPSFKKTFYYRHYSTIEELVKDLQENSIKDVEN